MDYTVAPNARIAGRPLRTLGLPHDVGVTLVVRGDDVLVPRGRTVIASGDHVFVALRNQLKPMVDSLFDGSKAPPAIGSDVELVFDSNNTLAQVSRFLGIEVRRGSERRLVELVADGGRKEPARLGSYYVSRHPDGDESVVVSMHPRPSVQKQTPNERRTS